MEKYIRLMGDYLNMRLCYCFELNYVVWDSSHVTFLSHTPHVFVKTIVIRYDFIDVQSNLNELFLIFDV